MNRIPVILDTDIGGDIDDAWALGMLLNCPELDLKLALSATGDTVYRARLMVKFLDRAGRSDVPVAVGLKGASDGRRENQWDWIDGYTLEQYPGKVFEDGLSAMIDLVEKSPEVVTVIGIGPLTNLGEFVRRRPDLAPKCRLVAMLGSVAVEHRDKPGKIAEFNVERDIAAAQRVFGACWAELAITPLDSCGNIVLSGENYAKVRNSGKIIPRMIMEQFDNRCKFYNDPPGLTFSTVLFDTVAVYMAYTRDNLVMTPMRLTVDDRGYLQEDAGGIMVNVAMDWHDRAAYLEYLTGRLLA